VGAWKGQTQGGDAFEMKTGTIWGANGMDEGLNGRGREGFIGRRRPRGKRGLKEKDGAVAMTVLQGALRGPASVTRKRNGQLAGSLKGGGRGRRLGRPTGTYLGPCDPELRKRG